jgi:hypothetical protein
VGERAALLASYLVAACVVAAGFALLWRLSR